MVARAEEIVHPVQLGLGVFEVFEGYEIQNVAGVQHRQPVRAGVVDLLLEQGEVVAGGLIEVRAARNGQRALALVVPFVGQRDVGVAQMQRGEGGGQTDVQRGAGDPHGAFLPFLHWFITIISPCGGFAC